MSGQTTSKLNHLLRKWPRGTVATLPWLERQGVYRQLARRYSASGWIESFGHGAFIRAGDEVKWPGGLYALQSQLELPVHAGGQTALALKGFAHHLSFGPGPEISLFGKPSTRLPAWFVKHPWERRVAFRCPNLFHGADSVGFVKIERADFAVRASAPERALLEVLHLATSNSAIEHSVDLMAGLSTLRPTVVQQLLEACRSVKVKRAFLWTAHRAGHRWFERLNHEAIDLGKGKRVYYRGGRLDKTYQITVPREPDGGV